MPRVREMYAAMLSRKLGEPLRGPVFGPPLIQGALPSLHHMGRRREIGLADLQVDDAAALLLQRPGLD